MSAELGRIRNRGANLKNPAAGCMAAMMATTSEGTGPQASRSARMPASGRDGARRALPLGSSQPPQAPGRRRGGSTPSWARATRLRRSFGRSSSGSRDLRGTPRDRDPSAGAEPMRSGGRSRGGVSEPDSRRDQTHEEATTGGRGAVRMASVNVHERADRRDGRLGGHRPGGGNRFISEIPVYNGRGTAE